MYRQHQDQQDKETASHSASREDNLPPFHPSDLASLPLRLTSLTERARRQHIWFYILTFSSMPFILLWLPLSSIWWPASRVDTYILFSHIFGPIYAVQGIAMVGLMRVMRQKRKLLRELAQIEDVRAIGPLLEILAYTNDRQILVPGKQALLSLLARLQTEDALLLTSHQYQCLLRRLSPFQKSEIHLAILQALEKIGDNRAVKPVERLVKRGRTPAIREEAARLLPILRERLPPENAPATLLRASEPSVEGLLRATEQESEVCGEELLQASQEQEHQP